MTDHPHTNKGWADTKAFRNIFLGVLIVAALAAAVAGFLPQFQKDRPHFSVEGMGAFFAVFGFVAFSFIVLAGQHLRKLVGRKEDYYEERE
jgi:uncharacterized membrane protein YozB (DUF420 family)